MCGVSVIRGLQREGSGFRVVGFFGPSSSRFKVSDVRFCNFGVWVEVSGFSVPTFGGV